MQGKYLVLGGSGLVGSAVLSKLQDQEGVSVVSVYCNNEPKIHAKNITHVQTDLRQRNEKIMQDVDYVFHLSSNIILRSMSEKEIVNRMTSNVFINMNILEAAYNSQIKKLLWISSSTAYPPKNEMLVEDDIFESDPADEYFAVGWINRFVEKMCVMYSQKNTNKFPIAIVRPTCIYGENEGFDLDTCHLLPYLVRKIIDKEKIDIWNDGSTKKDFIHVDDVVEACFAILNRSENFEVFNVGHGIEYSTNELIDIVCKLERIKNLNVTRRPVVVVNERSLSLSKMNELLNFVPQIKMDDGIRRLVSAYRRYVEDFNDGQGNTTQRRK